MRKFTLPPQIRSLVNARNAVREHYQDVLQKNGSSVHLPFNFDGNLVGDIGEALAVKLFGIRLVDTRGAEAIDGIAPDETTSVQVKATTTGNGPVFRPTKTTASHLLFFDLDFEDLVGEVVYNGPEDLARAILPNDFSSQRSLTSNQIRKCDRTVPQEKRLKRIDKP